jgi:hypothetical protein
MSVDEIAGLIIGESGTKVVLHSVRLPFARGCSCVRRSARQKARGMPCAGRQLAGRAC